MSGPTSEAPGDLWDAHAGWWKSTFTGGADVEYDREILPLVAAEMAGLRRVLDLGCGEGHVGRRLAADSPQTALVGADPSAAQLANAATVGGPIRYVRAVGEALPFADASFDGIYCSLAIEHALDPDAVLAEVARLLVLGGLFLLLVNHPLYQGAGSGFVDDQILGERYWRVGPYLDEVVSVEQVDAEVALPFAHRPISRYVNPLAERDVVMTKMLEPRPIDEFLASAVDPVLEAAIPRLLAMRFERRPPAARSWGQGSGASEEGTRARWPST